MAFLLIFRLDDGLFSEQESLRQFESIGVTDVERSSMPGAAVTGHFHHLSDSVIVEIKSDFKTIAISDSGPAGFEFAWRFQGATTTPLRMVDEAYSFDVELSDIHSMKELRTAIQ